MKRKKENVIPLQTKLDGFFVRKQGCSNDLASGSSVRDKITDTEGTDIEDLLTMKKKKKKSRLSPEDGKIKRKLKLKDIKSYFAKQNPGELNGHALRVLNDYSNISECVGDVNNDEDVDATEVSEENSDSVPERETFAPSKGQVELSRSSREVSRNEIKNQPVSLRESFNEEARTILTSSPSRPNSSAISELARQACQSNISHSNMPAKGLGKFSGSSGEVSTNGITNKAALLRKNSIAEEVSPIVTSLPCEHSPVAASTDTPQADISNLDIPQAALLRKNSIAEEDIPIVTSLPCVAASTDTSQADISNSDIPLKELHKLSGKGSVNEIKNPPLSLRKGLKLNLSSKKEATVVDDVFDGTLPETESRKVLNKSSPMKDAAVSIWANNQLDVSIEDMFNDSEMEAEMMKQMKLSDTSKVQNKCDGVTETPQDSVESARSGAGDVNKEPMLALKSQEIREVSSLFESEMPEFLEDWQLDGEAKPQLDLSSWQRCKVMDIMTKERNKFLTLSSQETGALADCVLKGVWTHSDIQAGSTVSVLARRLDGCWTVDNEEGFLILYPDLLVSGTAVVGSLFCQRKGVLSDWYRGIDCGNKSMVLGSLIHELLQEVLKRKMYEAEDIRSLVEELAHSPSAVHGAYSISMSMAELHDELLSIVPSILNFISVYMKSDGRNAKPPNWQGRIRSVISVEDNYWISQLGLKGKVDLSVEVQELGQSNSKLMPLELKTGRASNSIEHRGQVILYTLMAAETTPGVDAGLLLYLRESSVTKVQVGRNEKRDIICRRNELADYLTIFPSVPDDGISFSPPKLPEPINNPRACSRCPYISLCSAFLLQSGVERQFVTEATAHLTTSHIDYLVRWTALVQLEEAERCAKSTLQDLWCKTPAQREERGKCLANLVLQPPVMIVGSGCCVHSFKRTTALRDMRRSGLAEGEMVVVSTDTRVCLAMGTLLDVDEDTLTVDFPRDLSETHAGEHFHIDGYESQSQMSTTLTCLGELFENTNRRAKLRSLIIDRQLPMFGKTRPDILSVGYPFLRDLNLSQQQAVLQALAAHDYLLVKGRPGTGKTSLVAALIQLLVREGQSVLLTSHTHSAVDNVLLKLLTTGTEFLRLGSTTRIHDKIHSWAEDILTAGCNTPELLDAVYNSKPVVATTCHGANHMLFSRRKFDVCIVDESTQVLQPLVLCPLFHADRFILVGDPEQLPPVVRSRKAGQLGLSESLFVRLDRPETTVCLDEQYRMNSFITSVANALSYDGQLKCGSDRIANATVQVSINEEMFHGREWMRRLLSSRMEDSVIFLDTNSCSSPSSQDTNEMEAALVTQIVQAFIQGGVAEDHIGVIAPYRAQVALLRKMLHKVEVNTVDQYQGRDKELILFSCTKSCDSKKKPQMTEILNDKRRLTVAITRAKHKLVLVGDVTTLQMYSPFSQLIAILSPDSVVCLKDFQSADSHLESRQCRMSQRLPAS